VSGCEEAISAAEADRALDVLKPFDRVVLAVSGGPDSLALTYLVCDWHARLGTNRPVITVATVDHALRPESAAEAEIVATHCAELGFQHATLRWEGIKPKHGIPNAARDARYALLDAHAQTIAGGGTVAVVTAHHQDDQAETVFMRLARGGGVDALAAMAAERSLQVDSPVRLLRPFLGFSKAQLVASLSARGVTWIEDPTNSDIKYERTRLRQTLATSGLDIAAVAATARHMQDAREGLDYAASRFRETLQLSYNSAVYASFDQRAFNAAPRLLRSMVLAEVIADFGGTTPKPEVAEVEALVARIGASGRVTATLGGTVVTAGPRSITVWRELGRLQAPEVKLTSVPSQSHRQIWDDRFWVSLEGAPGTTVTVKPLGLRGFETIAALGRDMKQLPQAAVCGLPAFWADATLLNVPQLGIETAAGSASGLNFASTAKCLK
jgi:tRNA(Ile)-lysidine synthase